MFKDTASIVHTMPTRAGGSWRIFSRHFLEMLIAMVLGMAILGAIVSAVFSLLGHSNLLHYATLRSLLMASYMSAGMAVWMRHRKHPWPRIREMSFAMFGPFVALFVPFWSGIISAGVLLGAGHLLMLPAMLAIMLCRREEYSGGHGHHGVEASALPVHAGARPAGRL